MKIRKLTGFRPLHFGLRAQKREQCARLLAAHDPGFHRCAGGSDDEAKSKGKLEAQMKKVNRGWHKILYGGMNFNF